MSVIKLIQRLIGSPIDMYILYYVNNIRTGYYTLTLPWVFRYLYLNSL